MLVEREFSAGATKLYCSVGEQVGTPMVFLHGVGRGSRDFVGFDETLSVPVQPWLLDFRGHGRSASISGQYRVIDYADDVFTLLKQIEKPVVLYGHSL